MNKMGFTASMARQVAAMKNNAKTKIEKHILQCAYQGWRSVIITEFSPLYESAINNYEKLVDMGYEVDKYQYTNHSGVDSVVIYWGRN